LNFEAKTNQKDCWGKRKEAKQIFKRKEAKRIPSALKRNKFLSETCAPYLNLTADFVEKNSLDILQKTPLASGNMAEVILETLTTNYVFFL
jgi:hypothetical protein